MKRVLRRAVWFAALLAIFVSVAAAQAQLPGLADLAGKRIGILTGSTFDAIADEKLDSPQKLYYSNYADMVLAVSQDKLDGFIIDEPMGRVMCARQSGVVILPEWLADESYAAAMPKTAAGAALRERLNAYIAQCCEDGTLDALDAIWFGSDEAAKVVDVPAEGENGVLRMGVNSSSEPFTYISNGQIVGYEIDLLSRFCRENGYALEIKDMDFAAIIPTLVTEQIDVAAACICATEERAQSVHFSESYYVGGTVAIVKNTAAAAQELSFIESMKQSFEKNFIREDRWKLLASGLGVTVLISLCSGVLGAALGFGLCMLRRMKNRAVSALTGAFIAVIQGMPMLVLLMIFAYVIFAQSSLSSIVIAIIAFAINFAVYVAEMMRAGIDAVDPGQSEGALALGYTKSQSFFKIIFPQAARHFLPVVKGEFISLVKTTSIVGYIAIQDMTKASDIIRSRTYEAFFPLIVTAVIYFVVAHLLTTLLGRVEVRLDPKRRKNVLKGVTTR